MRIRKNHKAEVREFLFPELPAGEPPPPAYDCKVNRSPWDIPRGQDPFSYTLPLPPPHIVRQDTVGSKKLEGEYDDLEGHRATSVKGDVERAREGSEVDEQGEEHRWDDNWEIRNKGKDILKYYRRCRKKPLSEVVERAEEKADALPQPRCRSQRSTAGSNPDEQYYYYSTFRRRRGKNTRNGASPSGNNKGNGREDDKAEAPLVRERLEDVNEEAEHHLVVVAEENKGHATREEGSDKIDPLDQVDDHGNSSDDSSDDDSETTAPTSEADTGTSEESDGYDDESIGDSSECDMDDDDRYWLYGITK